MFFKVLIFVSVYFIVRKIIIKKVSKEILKRIAD